MLVRAHMRIWPHCLLPRWMCCHIASSFVRSRTIRPLFISLVLRCQFHHLCTHLSLSLSGDHGSVHHHRHCRPLPRHLLLFGPGPSGLTGVHSHEHHGPHFPTNNLQAHQAGPCRRPNQAHYPIPSCAHGLVTTDKSDCPSCHIPGFGTSHLRSSGSRRRPFEGPQHGPADRGSSLISTRAGARQLSSHASTFIVSSHASSGTCSQHCYSSASPRSTTTGRGLRTSSDQETEEEGRRRSSHAYGTQHTIAPLRRAIRRHRGRLSRPQPILRRDYRCSDKDDREPDLLLCSAPERCYIGRVACCSIYLERAYQSE